MTDSKPQNVISALPKNVELLPQTSYLLGLMTHLRNQDTKGSEFVRTVDRVARQLLPYGMFSISQCKVIGTDS